MVEEGDIRTTKSMKSFECWVKTTSDAPIGAQESLTEALTVPKHNVGKDAYIVDLESDEKLYWLDTDSGLLGDFGFEGTYTEGVAPGTLQRNRWEWASVTSTP